MTSRYTILNNMDKFFKLSELDEFLGMLVENRSIFDGGHPNVPLESSELHCPRCGGMRRMRFRLLFSPRAGEGLKFPHRETPFPTGGTIAIEISDIRDSDVRETVLRQLMPTLFGLTCLQCSTWFTGLLCDGHDGPLLAVFPSIPGGLATRNTPPGVAFYLDQAQRSRSVGAMTAAVAMYRGALEQILFEQGYVDGVLAAKIKKLESDIAKGACPKWAADLETDYLTVLTDFGDGSIHPGDGDISKRASLDPELLTRVEFTFSALLYQVYELPSARREHLSALQKAARNEPGRLLERRQVFAPGTR